MATTGTTGQPHAHVNRWSRDLARHLPHLSASERTVLALWSYPATLTEHIGQSTCAAFLAEALREPENTLRQRLREFYRPAALKRGTHRRDLDVRLAFAPLLRWAIWLLRPREVVLALDPTLHPTELGWAATASLCSRSHSSSTAAPCRWPGPCSRPTSPASGCRTGTRCSRASKTPCQRARVLWS